MIASKAKQHQQQQKQQKEGECSIFPSLKSLALHLVFMK